MSDPDEANEVSGKRPVRILRSVLVQPLPTDRVSFEKQLAVLRAYAAASGSERRAVSNEEVAQVVGDLSSPSVSLCNPFYADVGLLIQEGRRQRPADAVFDYAHAYEWDADAAGVKLREIFERSWAAKTLLPKLNFRQLAKDEAIGFLADAAKATTKHRRSLEAILDFLNVARVLRIDGNVVAKVQPDALQRPIPAGGRLDGESVSEERAQDRLAAHSQANEDVERFSIPIPGKAAATITVPKGLDAEDWTMLSFMIGAYIKRLRNERIEQPQAEGNQQ